METLVSSVTSEEETMNDELSVLNLMDRLAQEAHHVAPKTTTDRERFDALRPIAQDVRRSLDLLSSYEQKQVLLTIEQYLNTGVAPGITIPQDPREAVCFTQLLALIYDPPAIL